MSGAAQEASGPALPGARMEEPGWQQRSLGLEEGLGFRLSRLARVMRAAWAAQLAGLGLTPPQAAIIRGVAEHPDSSIRCLARLLGTDAMSVKRGADELERRGLLVSGSLTGDRRPRILQLSDRGTELLGELDALVWQQERVFEGLGPAQRRHLIETLTALEAAVGIGAAPDGSERCDVPGAESERAREEPVSDEGKHGEAGPEGEAGPHGHGAPHGQGRGAHDPGAAWDRRYTEVIWSDEPDPTMVELVSGLTPGRAVDLGGGTGRNALWLARNGWSVTVVDASAVGLGQAEQRARQMAVSITCERADLRDWVAGTEYDLVVLANVHMAPADRETLFKAAKAAVAPGGHLYVVGHHVEALGLAGPPDPQLLYTEEILTDLADGLRIEQLRRVEHRADHGAVGADIALFATRDRTRQPDDRGPFA